MEEEKYRKITVNVPADLYDDYREALRARTPRSNTTRDVTKRMVEVVEAYKRELRESKGE